MRGDTVSDSDTVARERPILFSGPMVRAILEGRKTMTRRVVKPQPPKGVTDIVRLCSEFVAAYPNRKAIKPFDYTATCPYGQPGDRLWVRETWRVGAWSEEGKIAVDYKADGYCRREWLTVDDENLFARLWQQSTDDAIAAIGQRERYEWNPGSSPCRWRPSIHMPRWASRLTLEILSVRVERVQDIRDDDAEREGVDTTNASIPGYCRERFRRLWDSINAASGYGWDANPLVWVVEFRRLP